MHSAAVAEWVLSMVAAPDRAASTVGDLVEEACTRGTLWFWSSVLQTAGSHLWRDLSASRLRMLGLALWGVAASWLLSFMFGLLLSMWWQVDFYQSGQLVGTQPSPWAYPVAVVSMYTVWPFLAGWEVARRSAGHELAAAFAVMAMFGAAMPFYYPPLEHSLVGFCSQALSVTAGAILFRRRTLARRKSPC